MLYFNLETVMKARQIERPYSFLVKAGISPHSATTLLNAEIRSLRLDHIEIVCELLHCEPNDLIVFKPSDSQKLQKNHPLNKFIPKEQDTNWQDTIKMVPIAKLKEIAKLLNARDKGEEGEQ